MKYITTTLLMLLFISSAGLTEQYVELGKEVSLHYRVSEFGGTTLFSTFEAAPLSYIHGTKQLVPGFEATLSGMKVGQSKSFQLESKSAYGAVEHNKILKLPRSTVSGMPKPGQYVEGLQYAGQPVRAKVVEVNTESITLDFNHPLAGKKLDYFVKILSIKDSPAS